jgi:hypothetical protein
MNILADAFDSTVDNCLARQSSRELHPASAANLDIILPNVTEEYRSVLNSRRMQASYAKKHPHSATRYSGQLKCGCIFKLLSTAIEWVYTLLGRFQDQILAWGLDNLNQYFMIFFSPFTWILAQHLQSRHGQFLPQMFPVYYWLTVLSLDNYTIRDTERVIQ